MYFEAEPDVLRSQFHIMQTSKQAFFDQCLPYQVTQFTDYQQIQRRTKIVSTLGPKCSDVETLKKMLTAGVNVFRLNFSFGDHDSMRQLVANIQQGTIIFNTSNTIQLQRKQKFHTLL